MGYLVRGDGIAMELRRIFASMLRFQLIAHAIPFFHQIACIKLRHGSET